MTTLLLTMIPHYREVILTSFSCDNCGLKNNEVQSGSRVQEVGVRFKCRIATVEGLGRQVVKSDHATVTVPEIELEIPSNSQKGGKSQIDP
jgi:zinc finger protein